MRIPRIVIAGLAGGTGKTTVSLGLARAFARRGLCVRPFKKGPDYVDTAWLGLAAGESARNLDPFMVGEDGLRALFRQRAAGADCALIEGNRGYFDGLDLAGSCSTAELARRLEAPVLLVVDCTKMTRTVAALVAGCRSFPGGERIAGVICNRTRALRHSSLVRKAVEELAGTPVLGVLPRLPSPPIAERQSGLLTVEEHSAASEALDRLADVVERHLALPDILALAASAVPYAPAEARAEPGPAVSSPSRIGYVRDAALWQYYEENLDALRVAGAELVPLSLFSDTPWPALDGLYLGGGSLFGHAAALGSPQGRLAEVASLARSGLPIYAENAGFFCLLERWREGDQVFPMAGVFRGEAVHCAAPQGLGYVEAEVARPNPYHPPGMRLKGHEYHYVRHEGAEVPAPALRRIQGLALGRTEDGFIAGNVFGAFMQLYAPAAPHWAPAFVRAARQERERKRAMP